MKPDHALDKQMAEMFGTNWTTDVDYRETQYQCSAWYDPSLNKNKKKDLGRSAWYTGSL